MDAKKQILRFLNYRSASIAFISSMLSLAPATTEIALADLVDAGKVEEGGGKYYLAINTKEYQKSRLIRRVERLFVACNFTDKDKLTFLAGFKASHLRGLTLAELERAALILNEKADLFFCDRPDSISLSIREKNWRKIQEAIFELNLNPQKLNKPQKTAIASKVGCGYGTVNKYLREQKSDN